MNKINMVNDVNDVNKESENKIDIDLISRSITPDNIMVWDNNQWVEKENIQLTKEEILRLKELIHRAFPEDYL